MTIKCNFPILKGHNKDLYDESKKICRWQSQASSLLTLILCIQKHIRLEHYCNIY